jgi:undecaprenyl-diphosphatase
MIQLGSILAIMWLYRSKIVEVLAGLRRGGRSRRFAASVFVAFLPALVAGAFLADFVKGVLYQSFTVIGVAFIAGGVVMLIVERLQPAPIVRETDAVPVGRAFGIGVSQTLSLVPGVSRSGATIVGGLLMGLDRATAAEFSFFLAMPTMMAAFVHDLLEMRGDVSARAAEIAVGFVMAFVAAAAVVKPFLAVVRRSGFAPFAWYRIAMGSLLLAATFFP